MWIFPGLLLAFASCTDFIIEMDPQDQWKVLDSGKIVLHYRPSGFSSSPSPDLDEARTIVRNQNIYYRAIQDSVQVSFEDKVLVYLFNDDEAEKLIGTNTGGHAIPKFNSFYFAYMPNRRPVTDQYHIENPIVGSHELVHVITHRALGYPESKMMSEGYAMWLDGLYGGYHIEDIIRKYRDEEPEKLMDPNQLLTESIDKESVYYPNCGIFTRFLIASYGLEEINRLFTCPADRFKKAFQEVTGESWDSMSRKYDRYLEKL